jgi:transposase
VALTAIRGDKTLAEVAEHFDVHSNQITQRKGLMLERAVTGRVNAGAGGRRYHRALQAKIGQLTTRNDLLEGALDKTGLWSASDDQARTRVAGGAPIGVAGRARSSAYCRLELTA